MSIFKNLKLVHKSLILLFVVLFGFFLVGISYKNMIEANEKAIAQIQNINYFGEIIDKIEILVSDARRIEKEFQLTGNENLIEKFDITLKAAYAKEKQLKSLLIENHEKELVKKVERTLRNYQQLFYMAAIAETEQSEKFQHVHQAIENFSPLILSLSQLKEKRQQTLLSASNSQQDQITKNFIVTIAITALIVSLLLLLYAHSINSPVQILKETVTKISEGQYEARTDIDSNDELGQFAKEFDNLLDERVTNLAHSEKENEQLNDSVIALLGTVSRLSNRDLTAKAPVTEDLTGPLADALNMLTFETSKVLLKVNTISEHVNRASVTVKSQSDVVMDLSQNEIRQIQDTMTELNDAVNNMSNVTELAQAANNSTDSTIDITEKALTSVTETVTSIVSIRDTVREAEKRIKRLGERSQEIGGIVDLIGNISERTHILALNASMHAASAGEAGRGFMVVADEVQRLAESARDATSQIATLVSNIQQETSDTSSTMNEVITRVVKGSRLAATAGKRMKETQKLTAELVDSIHEIAERSDEQIQVNNRLRQRAEQVLDSTHKTAQQLKDQNIVTDHLVKYANQLLSTVRIFKLPRNQKTG